MRQAVQCRLERFANASSKVEKDAIIWEVVLETNESGGRFLREDPRKIGWWEEVDQEVAKVKVSFYFRDLKFLAKAAVIASTSVATTLKTASAPASHLSASISLLDGSVQPGRAVPSKPAIPASEVPMSAVPNQELDSSTYEFLEQFSSRGLKRHKASHSGNNCGCFF
jgi:hypothetical protein